MTRTVLALVVALVTAASAGAQTAGPVLTLDEAVWIAIERNRTLQNAALSTERAALEVETARTRRLPVFGVEAQAARLLRPVDVMFPQGAFGEFESVGPVPATDTTVTTAAQLTFMFSSRVSQPVTQLIQANLNVHLSEAALEYEHEQVRATRLALVASVKRAYYAILQASSAMVAAEANARLLGELDRVVGNRVAQQVVLRADGLDVQRRLAQVELDLVTLRHSVATGKEQLNQLLGRNVQTPFDVAGMPDPLRPGLDLDVIRDRAVSERPDVKQARLRMQQADLSQRIAKAEVIPDVSLTFESLMPINVDGAPRNISTFGIQLQWEPFEWGRRGRTVAARGIEMRQAANALTDVESRAAIEINGHFRKVEEARARLRVAALSQETAGETARVRLAQFQSQAALLSDVLQSQAAFADTNNQYQQALLSLLTASADLEQSLGEEVTR
jgi:outer membrane protein TolC